MTASHPISATNPTAPLDEPQLRPAGVACRASMNTCPRTSGQLSDRACPGSPGRGARFVAARVGEDGSGRRRGREVISRTVDLHEQRVEELLDRLELLAALWNGTVQTQAPTQPNTTSIPGRRNEAASPRANAPLGLDGVSERIAVGVLAHEAGVDDVRGLCRERRDPARRADRCSLDVRVIAHGRHHPRSGAAGTDSVRQRARAMSVRIAFASSTVVGPRSATPHRWRAGERRRPPETGDQTWSRKRRTSAGEVSSTTSRWGWRAMAASRRGRLSTG